MGRKLKNAPVYFTVAQVRFNTVLNIDSYLPAIQERMRSEHFSDYKREVLKRISLPLSAEDTEQSVTPSILPYPQYIFGDIEGTSNFILESNSLGFQTTAYDTFEEFSKIFMKGIQIIHEALNLDFTERLGLRYLDAVIPTEPESLADYLATETLGLYQKLDSQLMHSVTETVTLNHAGHLVARVIIQNGHVGLPQDLASLAPKINTRFTDTSGLHAILDTDSFFEQREKFNLAALESRLSALHEQITKSFHVTVTPHAIKTWS